MSTPSKPSLIIFDLLTGLLDSWSAWDTATLTALSQLSNTPPSTETATHLGRAWRQTYLNITYNTGPYIPYEDLVREAAAKTDSLPTTAADILLNNYTTWLKPWPEVPSVLEELHSRGYKLAVATNCSKRLGHAAAALCGRELGLGEDVFDLVITSEESGWYKPRKEAYLAVLKRLGMEAGEALFVAGSASDVPGAAGAGLRVVWHNHIGVQGRDDAKPEKEGRSLEETLSGIVL